MKSILFALAFALSAPALAQDGTITGRDPDAFAEWKQAQGRYSARMREFQTDTLAHIDDLEAAETAHIDETYDATLESLATREIEKRDLAIAKMNDFLLRYPDATYSSHVRFRLAELEWDVATEKYQSDMGAYDDLQMQLEAAGRIEELPPEPVADLSGPIARYERIIADNEPKPMAERYDFLPAVYYSVGFAYRDQADAVSLTDAEAATPLYEKARAAFESMIREYPDDPLTDEAHLALGNLKFFEYDSQGAIDQYEFLLAKGPEGKRYEDALYFAAWTYFRMDVFDTPPPGMPADHTSAGMFTKLLDFSQEKFKTTGKRGEYEKEALRFLAITFVQWKGIEGDPFPLAQSWFQKVGPKEYEHDEYIQLAQVLEGYGKYPEAIRVYQYLQSDPRWKYHPDNPSYQMKVVQLWASGATPDLEQSGKARVALTEMYGPGSEWAVQNAHSPEALQSAEKYIRESFADVAIEYRIAAEKSDQPADYLTAANKLSTYLDEFPMADDYYDMKFRYADSLFRANEYTRAAPEFESLMRSYKHHKYGDAAVYENMQARRLLAVSKYGDPNTLPPGAVVERTYTTPAGKTVQVYALEPEYKDFLSAADKMVRWKFTKPTDPADTDWGQFAQEISSKVEYLEIQVLFVHNRFDEGRPLADRFIQSNRCTEEASFAASLIVNSYVTEDDLANVSKYARQFRLNPPGCEVAGEDNIFEGPEMQAAFEIARRQFTSGDFEAAASSFMQFRQDYPSAPGTSLPDALYNAALAYDNMGSVTKANALYEQYVAENPKEQRSADLYMRIAANYESTFDLAKAIDYYGRLSKNFPDDARIADAQFMQAFLRVGLGDHEAAAKAFEAYAAKYPEQGDAADIEFRAGEQWELVGTTQAISFYDRYRKKYGLSNPNRGLECDYKLSTLYRKAGNTRKADEMLDQTERDFDQIVADGKVELLTRESRHYAAEAGFREVQKQYDAFQKEAEQRVILHLDRRDEASLEFLKKLEADTKLMRDNAGAFGAHYGDFDYSMAALYIRADALLRHSDVGIHIDCDEKLSDDLAQGCIDAMDPLRAPFFEEQTLAEQELVQMIGIARDKKLHSVWVDKAYEALNERIDPRKYPAVKVEIPGSADATLAPEIDPVRSEE